MLCDRRYFKRELGGRNRRDPSLTAGMIKRYEAKLTKLISKLTKQIIDELKNDAQVKELASFTLDIRSFKDKLSKIITGTWKDNAAKEGQKAISSQVKSGAERSDQFLKQIGITADVGGMPVDPRVFDVLQERNLTELMGVGDDIEKRIIESVSTGILEGEDVRAITKRITERTDIAKSNAKRIARTETMNAFNKASEARYKKYGIEEVVWKTGGSNVCTNVKGFDGKQYSTGCVGLHGKIYPLDDHPPQPLHPNCKCILSPVIKKVE